MEVPIRKCACIFMCILAASAASFRPASASPAVCHPREFKTFLHDLKSQCSFSTPLYLSAIQVDGKLLESAMSSSRENVYTAVLYYASWCPFSGIFRSKFSTLSSMYPQIKHLMVEQSSAVPSTFSRYGIHSVPSLLVVNQNMRWKYHGRRDLMSLVNFYKRATAWLHIYASLFYGNPRCISNHSVTAPLEIAQLKYSSPELCDGYYDTFKRSADVKFYSPSRYEINLLRKLCMLRFIYVHLLLLVCRKGIRVEPMGLAKMGLDPVVDMFEDNSCSPASNQNIFKPWNGGSFTEIIWRELYLVLSVVFVLSRAILSFFPEIVSRITELWVACIPHLNLGIFGESRQLLGRVFHLIDVKRIWSKLNVCKTRNFHEGARNARVWASSLASVS